MSHPLLAKCALASPFLIGVAAVSLGGSAGAQMTSTNCMVSGNVVNCTSIGGGSYQGNDGARDLGEGIGTLIATIGEKNFRKKVGRMLADGDCQGASRYAYEKGRLELGASIAEGCRPAPASRAAAVRQDQPAVDPAELERTLVNIAADAKTPMEIFDRTTVTKVEANGPQLIMTAMVSDKAANITEAGRRTIVRQICEASGPLLQAGATVRINFHHQAAKPSRPFDVISATRRDCFL